jgi:hypothetical protein
MIQHAHLTKCPVCGAAGSLTCSEDLGEDGFFYTCDGPGGCGTSFIVTPEGECRDFY